MKVIFNRLRLDSQNEIQIDFKITLRTHYMMGQPQAFKWSKIFYFFVFLGSVSIFDNYKQFSIQNWWFIMFFLWLEIDCRYCVKRTTKFVGEESDIKKLWTLFWVVVFMWFLLNQKATVHILARNL